MIAYEMLTIEQYAMLGAVQYQYLEVVLSELLPTMRLVLAQAWILVQDVKAKSLGTERHAIDLAGQEDSSSLSSLGQVDDVVSGNRSGDAA